MPVAMGKKIHDSVYKITLFNFQYITAYQENKVKADQNQLRTAINLSTEQQRGYLLSFGVILCCLVSLLLPAVNSFGEDVDAAPAGTMVFLPFTIKTVPAQPHLQSGLTNILATRMTSRTGLIAVQRASDTGKLAALLQDGDQMAFKKMLDNLHGDYLLIGSLEQQESGYEIMVYVFNRNRSTPSSFSKKITSLDRAIPVMDELSIDIAEKVFNKKRPEQFVSTVPGGDGMSGFQTAHPDRAYREGLYDAATILGLDDDEFKVISSRRSRKITTAVRAMDVGDLDGDGEVEIVLLEKGNLALYHFNADHFQHLTDTPVPNHLGLHGVFLADVNGNGLLEIYIAASSNDKPASQVYEWDGKSFKTLAANIPFYLRPGVDAKGKQILLGQTGGIVEGTIGSSFYQMTLNNDGTVTSTERISVPRGFNIYDFIRVDLDQDGSMEFVGITRGNKLIVMDNTGTPLWKSEAGYGASKNFFGTLSSNRPGGKTPSYMHSRLIAQDQDGDGRPEIVIARNRLTTVKFMKRLRYFEGSSISTLSWDGSQMNTLWETKKTTGYTTDYQVINKPGSGETLQLFFLESDSSYPLFFWESDNSVIHLFEMGKNKAEKN